MTGSEGQQLSLTSGATPAIEIHHQRTSTIHSSRSHLGITIRWPAAPAVGGRGTNTRVDLGSGWWRC